MSIPDFQSFFLPLLQLVADGQEHPIAELRQGIAAHFALTPEDLDRRLPSGTQTVFSGRVGWSSVYLNKAGAIERARRGVFKITDRGREVLAKHPARLTVRDFYQYPDFLAFHKGPATTGGEEPEEQKLERTITPEEQLAAAYKELREALASEILETIKRSSPTFFEELVVDLLVNMGYGGTVEDAGKAVGKSGDGGIDGIIKEDKLGLDFVYLQAKRWANPVGRPTVQAFAGSLEGFRARKGVLITTSYFSQDAIEYVQKIEKRIVLINGNQLADLMIDHNVGVNVVQSYQIKRLNSDYFEE